MASATNIEPGRQLVRRPSLTSQGNADAIRGRAFARARGHSRMVRVLRIGLPVASVVLLGSYWLVVQRTITVGEGKLTLGPVSLSTEYLTMHEPRYDGFNKDGSHYVINAKTATQDLKQQNEIKLNDIDGKLSHTNNSVTTLTAVRGNYDSKANELELFEDIRIKSADGMTARLSRAKVFIKENRIVSEEPVDVEMPTGTVRGNSMVLLQKTREVTFSDGVTTRLKGQPKPDKPAAAAAPPNSSARRLVSGDGPVDITSPALKIDDTRKTALFSGGVRAVQGDSVLTARELEALYEGNADPTKVAADPAAAPGSDPGSRLKRLFARDNVVLTRGNDRVTSDTGEFDTTNDRSVLSGQVVFTSGADRQANGDRADIDQKADTVLLTGDVTILQGKNVLKGRRLFVDQKNATSQLSSPADGTAGAGGANRISARLYQSEAKQDEAKSAKPKPAATGDAGPVKFATDPTAPIDIEAELLEANDTAKTATFRGNVLAVQGDFKLRTSELITIYTGNAGLSLTESGGNAGKSGAQVQKIFARRKVVVTSKDDQSATGDSADFDVKGNTITINGNVVLNQARNIVRGPKLIIDMLSGEYRMDAGRPAGTAPGAASASATPPAEGAAGGTAKTPQPGQIPDIMAGTGPTACGGRMCLLIYPKELKDAAKRGADGIVGTLGAKKEQVETPNQPKRPKSGETPESNSSWSSTTFPRSD